MRLRVVGIVLHAVAWLSCLPAWAQAPATRYIPLQLIIGDAWNGEQTITYPTGRFVEGVRDGAPSAWTGPKQWSHPKTARTLTVYFRERDDQTAIGRVADSRFGITACDQEAKYPLGPWKQGEVRTFENRCWFGDRIELKETTITIQELDYSCDGHEHCLRVEWVLRNKGSTASPIDHRVYVFAPNYGVTREYKAQ
jgi:hypothetical protein